MSSGIDSFAQRVWAAIRELDARRYIYKGKIVQASASDAAAPGGPKPGRVLVSGVDPLQNVLVHPSMVLDDQVRSLGNAAVGRDVLVQSIGGQFYGVTIQLTGETRW